jgi:chaperonin GroEL
MSQIKTQIEDTSDYGKGSGAAGQASGGVAVVKVGAEVDSRRKRLRPGRVSTTRSGRRAWSRGVALLQAISPRSGRLVGDEAVGLGILRRALEAPIRQIADNAGAHGEVVVEHVKGLKRGFGYDALKGEYGDMFKKGIVDAAKVTRSALQNAASIAAMVLTTETLITDLPEKKQPVATGGGGYGGGRY